MKRISVSLVLVLFCMLASAQSKRTFQFTAMPYLQNMNTSAVSVLWLTNKPCTSYIKYGTSNALDEKAYASHNGQIDANMPVQKIRLEQLAPGKTYYYQVVSKEIKTYQAYKVLYGDSVLSPVYSFTLPTHKTENFSFIAFNDVHDRPNFIDTVCKENTDFDFVFYNGDIIGHINNEEQILDGISRISSKAFGTGKPFFYTRGNHETRGPESRTLKNYIESPGEDYYYSFSWGNTYFLVLDTGEDKSDDNQYYFGLADFDAYRTKQAAWIESILKSKAWRKAKHHIVCGHIPVSLKKSESKYDHGANDLADKIAPILNRADIDLFIGAHTHNPEIIRPNEHNNYPMVIGGGPSSQNRGKQTTFIKVNVSPKKISVELRHKDGEMIDQLTIK